MSDEVKISEEQQRVYAEHKRISDLATIATAAPARADLPLFKCHKVVGAVKIKGVHSLDIANVCVPTASAHAFIEHDVEGLAPVVISYDEYLRIRKSLRGDDLGYFVRYEDGYGSWSPTKAFEEGYAEVTAEAPVE